MQGRALVVLGLLALALGALWLRRQAQEEELTRPEEPLLPGVAARDVDRVEVDDLATGAHVVLERTADGRWETTQPVRYPANEPLVRALADELAAARGLSVEPPGGTALDLAGLGLDPPRAVVELRAGGDEARLEVGGRDVGGTRTLVRVVAGGEARVLRVPGDLGGRLASAADEGWRDRRATELDPGRLASFRRRGRLAVGAGGEVVDLTLDAVADPTSGWRAVAPIEAALDPGAMGLLARGAARLRAEGFADDAPSDLAVHGLADPPLVVELEEAGGAAATLRFGHPPGVPSPEAASWRAMREGHPFVWRVRPRDVLLLARPREVLYDHLVVRTRRDDVVAVELVREEGTLRLERGRAGWTVAEAGGPPEPADPAAVADVLGALEFAQVRAFDESATWPADAPELALAVETRSGARLGGALAPAGDAVLFRRFGDALVGTLDPALLELARTPLEALRSRDLLVLDEVELSAVALAAGGRERRLERAPEEGVWRAEDGAEAPAAFYPLLERLMRLRAQDRLPGGGPPLAAPVEVVVEGTFEGAPVRLVLGRTADGRAAVELAGGARAAVEPGLHDRALGLFGP